MAVLLVLVVVMATFSAALAGTKSRCDVVRALRAEGVLNTDMRDWLCLVKYESRFKYDALHHNGGSLGSDYGIFQMNNKFHCDRPSGTSSTTCWKLRTNGCKDTCASFRDSNISNDANCAVRVKNCDGFSKWYAWRDHCKGRDLTNNSEYNYSDC